MRGGRVVIPGDILGVIEEFLAGKNTYVDSEHGAVRSKILGREEKNPVNHVASVSPIKKPKLLEKGDVVYGYLDAVRDTIAFVKIFYIENKDVLLLRPYSSVLPAQNISSDPVRSIFNVYSYGDVLRAFVAEEGGPPYVISTRGREYGAILARCPKCMSVLKKRGNYLYCPRCGIKVRKKTSIHYLLR